MRILHVAEPFATGVLSFLEDLTKLQVEENDVYILWGTRPLTPPNVEELFDNRVHLIHIKEFNGAIGSVINPNAYRKIRQWYKKIKPDIVHLHSTASGLIGRIIIPGNKVPIFYTPHGYSHLSGNGSKLKRSVFYIIEKLLARYCKATTIACSEGEYKEALRLYDKHCTFVNNGINTEQLDSLIRPKEDFPAHPTIATSGRILLQKNPKLFNEIALSLPEYNFVWVGAGELKTELTAPNIKITGWQDREYSLKEVASCDLFVLTSLWEGLPISLLEAMYLKKTCIVSNVIGNNQVITPKQTGYLCDNKNDFISAIKDAIKNVSSSLKMGERAHDEICSKYSIKIMAERYNEIYRQEFKKHTK